MSTAARTRTVLAFFIVGALLLVVRLYMLQVLSADRFRERADRQYSNPTQHIFDRGAIYFQTKDNERISAATLKSGFIVAINPTLIKNPEETYHMLNAVIPLDKDTFIQKASKKDDPYEEVMKRVPEDVAARIEDLKLSGVRLFRERWRYYPGNTLAAQTVGFMGYKGDEFGGRYGLENFYESILKRGSKDVYVNFFAEIFSNINKTVFYAAEGEGTIITTIEPHVQAALEKELKETQKTFSSKSTAGIIINPRTGEIYALGAVPTFDPNNFGAEKDPGVYSNPLVQSVYEMGSVIKPLTVAAGLDAGVITPTTTYTDEGKMTLNNKTFYNYDKRGRGVTSMQEVLNQSLNTGVATIALKLGNDRFNTYFYNLGFNTPTQIDLPGERDNLIANLKSDRDIEHATAAFGQGIALTPISTVRALAALGNGGYLIQPHLVKKIEYTSGFSKTIAPTKGQQVFSEETSRAISKMLTTVVDDALLEGSVKLPHYSVAAKTGTAQIASPTGGYYEDRFLHSFFGYFPSYDPQFLIFLYTVEPQKEKYASHTLTKPFMNMVQFLINYYTIVPDR